jgi:uncharacterized surface protein with fasciclin (FAS1) repeats
VDTLKDKGPFTVLAPTDEAFAELPKGTVGALLKDIPELTSILTFHVAPGLAMAEQVVGFNGAMDGQSIGTVNGANLLVGSKAARSRVSGANVVKTDIMTSNGVIHVIDSAALPPDGPMAKVAKTSAAALPDIVDTAVAAGSFKTLTAALGAAGLVDTLKSKGHLAVLAPTDEAFAKLPKGTVEDLLKPENKAKLAAILTYHVLSGVVKAATVVTMDGQTAATVNGASVAIGVKGGKVTVAGANVVTTDIMTSNGVIHVIDSVILPPSKPATVTAKKYAAAAAPKKITVAKSSTENS